MPDVHWLAQYASSSYAWQASQHHGRSYFHRPMGLVEQSFDADGRYFEGRADMNLQIDLTVTSKLDRSMTQQHIILAWACLRARHVLLQSQAPAQQQSWASVGERHFLLACPLTIKQAVDEARSQVTFLDDYYSSVEALSFYNHAQNCRRLVDPEHALAKLYVLPEARLESGSSGLSMVLVLAHQIGDGIAMGEWIPDFARLLNMPDQALQVELSSAIRPERMRERLPLPQEALYPLITGSRARQRWFWLLTRILRHVRKPLPAGFQNPLRLDRARPTHAPADLAWSKVLDYGNTPPNNSATCRAKSSRRSTKRLATICRKANVSIGAGCFALAALLMMEFYEQREPDVPLHERKPVITGFPLNPRPFLRGSPSSNSLMLAFSDGILLPFLPSSLDLDGRLRLLAKQAQRQLAVYQKRKTTSGANENEKIDMGSRGAGRMLAIQYISSIERCDSLSPQQSSLNPQGDYPMRPNVTRQTCGVSSTGRGNPLASLLKYENADFVAVPVELFAGVRAREGEFLIGVGGGDSGLSANVSVDTSSMDSALVAAWRHRFESILEHDEISESRL